VTTVNNQLVVSTFIISDTGILNDSLFLYYSINGNAFNRAHLQPTSNAHEFSGSIPNFSNTVSVVGYFSIYDSTNQHYLYPSIDTIQHLLTIETPLLQNYALSQNYTNPFNGETTILFESPVKEEIEVIVFNVLGQKVKIIYHGQSVVGTNTFHWEGTNEQGIRVATGVYFAHLKTPQTVRSIKMLYLK